MPVFRYKAVNPAGAIAVGELEAANESEIVERLRDQGLMPTQVARAAEAGGALGTVLTRLADTMERNKELRESVVSALIYPSILIGVAVLSLMLILAYVVPQFEQTFAQAGRALPLPTQVVIFVGAGI